MKKIALYAILLGCVVACKTTSTNNHNRLSAAKPDAFFKIAFGSCNKTEKPNIFWDDIVQYQPDVWIWGGDIIYADTDNMAKLQAMYQKQKSNAAYKQLIESTLITGVWDDHDYGLNDGGVEFTAKAKSQQAFLDFMNVPANSPRRQRAGTYHSITLQQAHGSVKIINLDTRYFRSSLKKSDQKGQRYQPDTTNVKTMLGKAQWQWLANELQSSTANFNLIVSSIQVLSAKHGFEKWANFPHELERLQQLIANSGAKGVIILSGDRHISEFSKTTLTNLPYPLIDFTSSGLTHAYTNFSHEVNPLRVQNVIAQKSYGALELNTLNNEVVFKMMANDGVVLQTLKQSY